MNDAVFKLKCYEDSSLSYTGIDKHESEEVGLFDTVLSHDEARKVAFRLSQGRPGLLSSPRRIAIDCRPTQRTFKQDRIKQSGVQLLQQRLGIF
jgi:hypothetical protein